MKAPQNQGFTCEIELIFEDNKVQQAFFLRQGYDF